ncbi:MAG: hypothetical protein ABI576_07925 [Flavobacterium sp.]
MKNKRNVLCSLIIMLAGEVNLPYRPNKKILLRMPWKDHHGL